MPKASEADGKTIIVVNFAAAGAHKMVVGSWKDKWLYAKRSLRMQGVHRRWQRRLIGDTTAPRRHCYAKKRRLRAMRPPRLDIEHQTNGTAPAAATDKWRRRSLLQDRTDECRIMAIMNLASQRRDVSALSN